MSEAAKTTIGAAMPSSFFAKLSKLPQGSHSFLTPARKAGRKRLRFHALYFADQLSRPDFKL
jgi:hypothetical protein